MRPFLASALRPLAALAVLCAALPAHADEDQRALLVRGVELRREHRLEEALAVFQRAVALAATPSALAQRGLAEQQLGRWLDASRDLDAALADPDDPWIAKNEVALEKARAIVRDHVPATDTQSAVATPAAPPVAPVAAPPAPSAPPPAAAASPPAGPTPAPVVIPESSRSLAGPLVLGATGLLGVGVGTYFGVRTFEYKSDRDAQCTGGCKPAALTYDADARSAATTSTIAFGVGIAGLVAGAAWWLVERGSPLSRAPIQIGPMVGQGHGLVVGGSL